MARTKKAKSNKNLEVTLNDGVATIHEVENKVLPIQELMKIYIPQYISECTIEDDNTISLYTLEQELLMHSEIAEWAMNLPSVRNSDVDSAFDILFDKFDDDEIYSICKFIRKKYDIQVTDLGDLTLRDDIREAIEEANDEEEDFDDPDTIFKNMKKKGKTRQIDEYEDITRKFCRDINIHSTVMTPDEEFETFQKWEDGMKMTLLGFAAVPALTNELLLTIENAPDKEMKQYIKGLEEDAFSVDEREQIKFYSEQVANYDGKNDIDDFNSSNDDIDEDILLASYSSEDYDSLDESEFNNEKDLDNEINELDEDFE